MATTGQGSEVQQKPSAPLRGIFDRQALNLPNLITVGRLFLAGVLFVLIFFSEYPLTATGLFILAASTDALDGYIARRYGMVTVLGRILDPFVDKIIVVGAFIFLLPQAAGVNAWMVVVVVGREMFVSSLRGFLEQCGLDFSANWTGKLKMFTQCVAVTASLLSLSSQPLLAGETFAALRDGLLWLAVAVTAYSGIVYIVRAALLLRTSGSG